MAKQIVLDATGDSKFEFNPADAAALQEAERRFKELTGAGFIAAVRTSGGQSELVRNFEPTAEETLFFPRLKGGWMGFDLLWDSGLPLLLALCALAWSIGLLCCALEHGCRKTFCKAERRASTLLKRWLTREQCVQYERSGYFEVKGSHSGNRYRIRAARQMNVDQLDEQGRRVAVLSFLPEKYLPVSDVMLAQKIVLENDEDAALSVAYRRYYQPFRIQRPLLPRTEA
jgi:hypothetical protein